MFLEHWARLLLREQSHMQEYLCACEYCLQLHACYSGIMFFVDMMCIDLPHKALLPSGERVGHRVKL